jgi:hypothetical protein
VALVAAFGPAGGSGTTVATDVIFDAKGDLPVGTGADTAARLAVGTNNQVLTADSAQTTGVKWAAAGAGAVATDTIWDAKGDLAAGTGADTASKLTVGANNTMLVADSAQATGLKWAAAPGGAYIATDTLWDTKGDLAAATGADAAAKLPIGTFLNDRIVPDTAASTGLKWIPHVVRRTADASAITSNTTLASDSQLLWAVAANEVWYFQGFLLFGTANVNMDVQIGWAVPASTTMSWGALGAAGSSVAGYQSNTTAGSPSLMNGAGTALNVGLASGASTGVNIAGVVVVAGTAGNVNIQFAQATSDAGNLVPKANSILLLWRLA